MKKPLESIAHKSHAPRSASHATKRSLNNGAAHCGLLSNICQPSIKKGEARVQHTRTKRSRVLGGLVEVEAEDEASAEKVVCLLFRWLRANLTKVEIQKGDATQQAVTLFKEGFCGLQGAARPPLWGSVTAMSPTHSVIENLRMWAHSHTEESACIARIDLI